MKVFKPEHIEDLEIYDDLPKNIRKILRSCSSNIPSSFVKSLRTFLTDEKVLITAIQEADRQLTEHFDKKDK